MITLQLTQLMTARFAFITICSLCWWLLLAPITLHAKNIRFSCTSWGCGAFQESAQIWAEQHQHTVVPYEIGRLADNLLGLYRQVFSIQSDELDLLLIDTIWPGVLAHDLIDLHTVIPQAQIDGHFKTIIANLTDRDGRLVAMPLFTDVGVLYYRSDLLAKYGLTVPTTWDELAHHARVILEGEQDPALAGFIWQGQPYEGLTCNALEWIDSYRGGTIIDTKGTITINNPQAHAALKMAQQWLGTISPPEVLTYTEAETALRFRAGHAIFMRNWVEYWSNVNDVGSPVRGVTAIAPIPKGGVDGQHSGTLGDMSLAISRYSKHPDIAGQLLSYLTAHPAQKQHALVYSFNPTLEDLYDDPELRQQRPYIAIFKKILNQSVARPAQVTGISYPKVSRKFYTSVYDILSGKQDVDSAILELEQALQRIKQHADW
jgi:trehalose/maltose transport system substrate-binding protein